MIETSMNILYPFSQCDLFSEPTEEEIRAAIVKEDSKRARVAEILMAEGEADANSREKNGRQTPLHLCAMNGYAKVRKNGRTMLYFHRNVPGNVALIQVGPTGIYSGN